MQKSFFSRSNSPAAIEMATRARVWSRRLKTTTIPDLLKHNRLLMLLPRLLKALVEAMNSRGSFEVLCDSDLME